MLSTIIFITLCIILIIRSVGNSSKEVGSFTKMLLFSYILILFGYIIMAIYTIFGLNIILDIFPSENIFANILNANFLLFMAEISIFSIFSWELLALLISLVLYKSRKTKLLISFSLVFYLILGIIAHTLIASYTLDYNDNKEIDEIISKQESAEKEFIDSLPEGENGIFLPENEKGIFYKGTKNGNVFELPKEEFILAINQNAVEHMRIFKEGYKNDIGPSYEYEHEPVDVGDGVYAVTYYIPDEDAYILIYIDIDSNFYYIESESEDFLIHLDNNFSDFFEE